jgi:predicted nucleic acid-binding protein
MVASNVLLDAGPLGLATTPNRVGKNADCARWLQSLLAAGKRVIIPELADYEIRRELLRANKTTGFRSSTLSKQHCLPINTAAMRLAAQLWAQARQQGQPTANDDSIDGDMILVAQALSLGDADFVIATTNVGHLSRSAPAAL